jgi:SOS response regulatory protein OraA/RecX
VEIIEREQAKKARKTTISPDWMLKASGREFVVYRGFPANAF